MSRFGPPLGRTGVWVFAVEDTAAQVTWRSLPPGGIVLEARPLRSAPGTPGPASSTVEVNDGPGALSLTALAPATDYQLVIRAGSDRVASRVFTTLPRLAGPELSRFATISDIHIGDTGFGILKKQRAPEISEGFPTACARAAIAEAVAWGAQAIVVKGDLTRSSRTLEVMQAAQILTEPQVPVLGVLGNHDVVRKGVDAAAILATHDVDIGHGVRTHDLPGIRIVLVPTAEVGRHSPRLRAEDLRQLEALATEADTPLWVGLHHYLQPLPFALTYPPGLPSSEANRLLGVLRSSSPSAVVSVGHSHRCRLHHRQGLPISEIGAPKDFPGVWAGYVVHPTGIRQVVRRIADPRCLAWNDRTRRAAAHAWGWYAPGTLSQRCFVHRWPGG